MSEIEIENNPKKPYAKPAIQRYGTLLDSTLGPSGGASDGGGLSGKGGKDDKKDEEKDK